MYELDHVSKAISLSLPNNIILFSQYATCSYYSMQDKIMTNRQNDIMISHPISVNKREVQKKHKGHWNMKMYMLKCSNL